MSDLLLYRTGDPGMYNPWKVAAILVEARQPLAAPEFLKVAYQYLRPSRNKVMRGKTTLRRAT